MLTEMSWADPAGADCVSLFSCCLIERDESFRKEKHNVHLISQQHTS